MAYKNPKPGEWVKPVMQGYKMACCDCGLVHSLDFSVDGDRVLMRAFRDPRATGGKRAARAKAAKQKMPPVG